MKSSMKRVLVDVDGVLADFLTPTLKIVHEISGFEYKEDDFPTWDIFDTVPKVYREQIDARLTSPGFARDLFLYPNVKEGFKKLQEIADVYILTSPYTRSPTWVHERGNWLRDHLGVPSRKIIYTAAKYTVLGDIFVDDCPEHIEKWAAHHPTSTPILWDRPYNRRELDIQQPWVRAVKWNDIFEQVELK